VAYVLSFWPEMIAGFIAASFLYIPLIAWPDKTMIGPFNWKTIVSISVFLVLLIVVNWLRPPPELDKDRLMNFDVFHMSWLIFFSYFAIRKVQKRKSEDRKSFFRKTP
jgi:hypothetical protein